MPTTIVVLDGNSSAKTVTTLEAYGTAAGTPSTNAITVQNSTVGLLLASSSPGVTALGQTTKAASLPVTVASDSSTWLVNPSPATSGGLTPFTVVLSSGTNSTLVSSAAIQFYGAEIYNNSSNLGFLRLYNLSSAPTVGTSSYRLFFMVPGNSNGTGSVERTPFGVPFTTGLGFTFTGAIGSTDTTVVASSAFAINLYYK